MEDLLPKLLDDPLALGAFNLVVCRNGLYHYGCATRHQALDATGNRPSPGNTQVPAAVAA
jgi:hypothetical protein